MPDQDDTSEEGGLDLRVLRDGSARRLVGADFASMIGDTMTFTAMAFAVFAVGGSEFQVGLALAAQGAGTALTLLFGGVVGDRYPRRFVMVSADLLRFASQGIIAVLLLTGDAAIWHLIAAQLVHGVGSGFYMPASSAIVPDCVDAEIQQPTNSLKQLGKSVAALGGPALGAAAFHLAGAGLALAADAFTFLASAALLSSLTARTVTREKTQSMLAELRHGWTEFVELRWMRAVTVQFTLVNALSVAPFFVFGPSLAAGSLGGINAWAALLFAMAAGELIGGGIVMFWRPRRPLVAATAAFMLWAIPLALLAVQAPLFWTLGGGVIGGAGSAIFGVLWETTVQKNTEEDVRSRLMAFEQFGSLVGVPFGFVLAGWFGEVVGADTGLIGAVAFLIAAGLVVLSLPSIRELGAREDDRPAVAPGIGKLDAEGEAA